MLFEDPDPDTGFMLHPDLKWVSGTLIYVYFQIILTISCCCKDTKHTDLGLCLGQDPSTGKHLQVTAWNLLFNHWSKLAAGPDTD